MGSAFFWLSNYATGGFCSQGQYRLKASKTLFPFQSIENSDYKHFLKSGKEKSRY